MFLVHTDITNQLREKRLQEMIDSDTAILDACIDTAVATLRDALYSRYNTTLIFSAVGTARLPQVVWWATTLAVYYLYQRMPDKLIPDRVIKNYDDTIALLTDIEDGKKSTMLPLRTDLPDGEGGNPVHKARFSITKPRSV